LLLADGSEYPVKGRIVTASGLISTETGSVSFRANFPNAMGLIRSGNSATIKIPVNIDTALLIPQSATYDMQGKKFVYTLSDKDSTVNTGINVSENAIGKFYMVEDGLRPGDKLIIEGIGSLRPGMAIKPVPVNADSLYAGVSAIAGKSPSHK
jgi:membrane fusion protein (multidrug efflux system)